MAIWLITGGLALAVALPLAWALVFGRREAGPAAEFDLRVYRDQLREIERDAARGIVAADEAERLRTEIARRMLSADAKMRTGARTTNGRARWHAGAAIVLAVALVGGSFALYLQMGAPGYRDLPLAQRIALAQDALENRPSQSEIEARVPPTQAGDVPEDYRALVQRLRDTVAERPDDVQGLAFLTRSEAALGNYQAAYAAQSRLIAAVGDSARSEDYAVLADLMILAAGGYVSPEAEDALTASLQRDPANGLARYYAGLLMDQTGRPDVAFRMWRSLLVDSDADAPWAIAIRDQIEDLAMRAGDVNFRLPPAGAPSGPSAEDIAAAQDLTEAERQDMIQGMVARLSDRLATEGGPAEDWTRLIRAHGVLGDRVSAQAVYVEARTVFAGDDRALRDLYDAAQDAEIVN